MKRSYQRSELSIRALSRLVCLLLVACFALSGCYEGGKSPGRQPKGDGGGGGGGKKPGPSDKTIGLAILDIFTLSEAAMKTPGCFSGPTSLIEFRRLEALARASQLQSLLKEMSDQLVLVTNEIEPKDCRRLQAIEMRADSVVAQQAATSSSELRLKPAVHVKAVMWDEDVTGIWPPPKVYAGDWIEMKRLGERGFQRRLSVLFFALSGQTYGYHRGWRDFSPWNTVYSATPIDQPDVSEAGEKKAKDTIAEGTQGFALWLSDKVGQL